MAKKRAAKKDTAPKTIEDQLVATYGENILSTGNYVFDKERMLIPISHSFNVAIDGFYDGTAISLAGLSQCGKTSFALDFAKTCQQSEYGSRPIYYYDVEARLSKRNVSMLDRDKFFIISSQPGKILSGEDYLQIACQLISEKEGAVHIIDSLGMMATKDEITGDMSDNPQLGGINRLTNRFVRKIANPIRVNNCLVIFINHVYSNIGYGSPVKEKISSEVTYIADYRLLWKRVEPWKLEDDYRIGQKMDIEIVKSATSKPNIIVSSYLRYEPIGLDNTMEMLSYAIDVGLVKKAGSWFIFRFMDEDEDKQPRLQGIHNAYNQLIADEEMFNKLKACIMEIME